MYRRVIRYSCKAVLATTVAVGTLCFFTASILRAQTSSAPSRILPTNTRFFVPDPPAGSIEQAITLLDNGKVKDALLIGAMVFTPQAVWLTGSTPAGVEQIVRKTMQKAALEKAVPLFVIYNVPGRDCGSYSAGGAQDTPAYIAWIDAIAGGVGDRKAAFAVEPDALAKRPSDCG